MAANFRNVLYIASATFVLAGSALYLWNLSFAPWLFAFGTAGMAVQHLSAPTKTLSTRNRRLQMFKVIACLLMLVASVFMFRRENEWIICLSISAILFTYASFTESAEPPKDKS